MDPKLKPNLKTKHIWKPYIPHRQLDISQANNLKSKTSNPKATVLGHAAKTKPMDPPLFGVGFQPDLIPIITNPTSNPKSVAQILPNKAKPTAHPLSKTTTHISLSLSLSLSLSHIYKEGFCPNKRKKQVKDNNIILSKNFVVA